SAIERQRRVDRRARHGSLRARPHIRCGSVLERKAPATTVAPIAERASRAADPPSERPALDEGCALVESAFAAAWVVLHAWACPQHHRLAAIERPGRPVAG